jgi:hypothetical protein
VGRDGLENPATARALAAAVANQLSLFVEERIVAFAHGQPGLGPKRIAGELRKSGWGGLGRGVGLAQVVVGLGGVA